jgi:hypothetical protein
MLKYDNVDIDAGIWETILVLSPLFGSNDFVSAFRKMACTSYIKEDENMRSIRG